MIERKSPPDPPPIEQSLDLSLPYQNVESRYYCKYFYVHDQGENQVVLLHSNRICLVALAPSHPVIKERKTIKKLNFDVSKNCNRLNNKVSGKGKKGGQGVDERAILCYIECESGETFSVKSCVKGKLISINQKVVENPNLILDKSSGEAHLAIILTKIPEGIDDLKSRLVPEQEYFSIASSDQALLDEDKSNNDDLNDGSGPDFEPESRQQKNVSNATENTSLNKSSEIV